MLKLTFFEKGSGRTAYQSAQAYNLKYAITGEYPDQYVDKKLAFLCKGDLPLADQISCKVTTDEIFINWNNKVPIGPKRMICS
ncbi:DUF6266 family protein [Saccharicrinis aurantiacus]|uniref:DUF6266 family protein n=1 Tax=Saccharicrinis aurantiacus TaxID=1849719 RepID=UPI003742530A